MEVDLVLVVDSDKERGDINDLTVDSNMSTLDQNSGVMNGVGELGSENASLESSFKKLVEGHSEDVIETVLGFSVQQTELEHLPEKGGSFEESTFILRVEG